MTNFYDFAGNHPFLTIALAYFAAETLIFPFKMLGRYFRAMNIKNAGWPPAHLDADGDVVKKSDE